MAKKGVAKKGLAKRAKASAPSAKDATVVLKPSHDKPQVASTKAAKVMRGAKAAATGDIRIYFGNKQVLTVETKAARRPERPGSARDWVNIFGEVDRFPLDLQSELRLSSVVSKGFPTEAVEVALETGLLDLADVNEFVVSRRTYERRREEEKPLTPDESDKLARIMRVMAQAEQVLGDKEKAARWLRKRNRALDGKEPFDLLSNDVGARAVEKVLGRIEHGVFS